MQEIHFITISVTLSELALILLYAYQICLNCEHLSSQLDLLIFLISTKYSREKTIFLPNWQP